jgi:hypothetical protein
MAYYAARAAEYDDVYGKPERQDDIRSLRTLLRELLSGHSVLEVACGTGFWTEEIAVTASHILHGKLRPGALLVFTDNRNVAGSSLPVTREDADGNTYQKRRLRDGTEHEVLKNFPHEAEIRSVLRGRGNLVDFRTLTYYWCVSYRAT